MGRYADCVVEGGSVVWSMCGVWVEGVLKGGWVVYTCCVLDMGIWLYMGRLGCIGRLCCIG